MLALLELCKVCLGPLSTRISREWGEMSVH